MKDRYLQCCLIIQLLPIICFGQKDYKPGFIITNNNDTVSGFINLKSNNSNSRNCEFREKNEEKSKDFSPQDIKGYRIENNKYYVSRLVLLDNIEQKVFLEYLVDGIVDLYYLKEFEKEYYFIEKDSSMTSLTNEPMTVVGKNDVSYFKNSEQYKGVLRYLFHDSPGIKDNISKTTYDYQSLIRITKDYHKSICKDYECIDYTKSTFLNICIEPFAGIINSWMGLKTSKDYVYNIKPYIGINLRFKPLKGYYLWNFLLGLNFSTNDFTGDYKNKLFVDFYHNYRIDEKYSILRIPITVEYSFPTKRVQPFLSLSYVNVFLLNPEYNVSSGYNNYLTSVPSACRTYQYGISGGIGIKYILKSSSYLFLKTEFEYRAPVANFRNILDYQFAKSWLISFGYGFNLK